LSRGSSPSGHPAEPLVSYQINRQFSGWILPPQVIRAFGAHCQEQTSGALLDHLVGKRWSTAGGPAKENISNISLLPGIRRSLFVDSKAEGGEEIPGLISSRRCTADRHVISKAVRSRVTACCDVGDEVSPEAYYMVLEITVAAIFE
jgi:hypothetical protein